MSVTDLFWVFLILASLQPAMELGLSVSTEMLQEVYDLMQLYPQAAQRRPSVQYIPIPYQREEPEQPSPRH